MIPSSSSYTPSTSLHNAPLEQTISSWHTGDRRFTPTNPDFSHDNDNEESVSNDSICTILYTSFCSPTRTNSDPLPPSASSSNITIKLIHILLRHFYLVSLVVTLSLSFLPTVNTTYGLSAWNRWETSTSTRYTDNGNTIPYGITNNSSIPSSSNANISYPIGILSLPNEDIVVLASVLSQSTVLTSFTITNCREMSLFFIALSFFIQGILYSWSISTLHRKTSTVTRTSTSSDRPLSVPSSSSPTVLSLEPTPVWKYNVFRDSLQTLLQRYFNDTTHSRINQVNTDLSLSMANDSDRTLPRSKSLMVNPLRTNPSTGASNFTRTVPTLSPLKKQEKVLFTIPPSTETHGVPKADPSFHPPSISSSLRPTYVYIPPYRHPTTGYLIPGGWIETTVIQTTLQQHKSIFDYIYYPCTCIGQYISQRYTYYTANGTQSLQYVSQCIAQCCTPCVALYRYVQSHPFVTAEVLYYVCTGLFGPYILAGSLAYYFVSSGGISNEYITPLCLTLGFIVFFTCPSIPQLGDGVTYVYRHIDTDYEQHTYYQRIRKIKKSLLYFTLFCFLAPSIFQSSWQLFDTVYGLYTDGTTSRYVLSTASLLSIGKTTGTLLAVTIVPFWIPILVSSVYRLSGISSIPFCLRFPFSYYGIIFCQQLCVCVSVLFILGSYPLLTFWLRDSTTFTHSSTYTGVVPSSLSSLPYVLNHPIVGIVIGISGILLVCTILPLLMYFLYGIWIAYRTPVPSTVISTAILPSLSYRSPFFYHPIYTVSRYVPWIDLFYLSFGNRTIGTIIAFALSLTIDDDTVSSYRSTIPSKSVMDVSLILPVLELLPSSSWYRTASSIDIEISILFQWIRYCIILTTVIYTCLYHLLIYIGDKGMYHTRLGHYVRNPMGFIDPANPTTVSTFTEPLQPSLSLMVDDTLGSPVSSHKDAQYPITATTPPSNANIRTVSREIKPNSRHVSRPSIDPRTIEPKKSTESTPGPTPYTRTIALSPADETTDANDQGIIIDMTDTESSDQATVTTDDNDTSRNGEEEDESSEVDDDEHVSSVTSSVPVFSLPTVSVNTRTDTGKVLPPSVWNNYIQSLSSLSSSTNSTIMDDRVLLPPSSVPILHPVPDPTGKAPFILVPINTIPNLSPSAALLPKSTITISNTSANTGNDKPLQLSELTHHQ